MALRILALEPYYGGSHRAFLDGYCAASRHSIELLTMPARKWKWRMRGAALAMSESIRAMDGPFDVLLASDYLDLACLVALLPAPLRDVPRVVYFHENQITYPLADEDERDYQYGFTNITACLAADRVIFNSRYHMESFLDGAGGLLRRMPDFVPAWAPDAVRRRARVVPVGVDLSQMRAVRADAGERSGRLRVLWNHRWEYDKCPEEFFEVMAELQDAGCDFDLAVLGQSFDAVPPVFEEARERFAGRLKAFGYVESREEYWRVLLESDVVVSTAAHEFFGISVVEAACAGCVPLLPNRLSYPELLPDTYHSTCLYADRADMKKRLAHWLRHPDEARAVDLSADMRRFGWSEVAPVLDAVMDGVQEAD